MDVLHTGVPALDEILGGGIPARTTALILGVPGAGKTILATQIALAQARAGARVLVFTALSESHEQLLASLRQFAFFDEALIGDRVRFLSIQTILHEGLSRAAAAIVETARANHTDLVILDGFRGLASFANDSREVRNFLYDVRSQLALLNTTTLVTMETSPQRPADEAALTMGDGIIVMRHALAGVRSRRHIEVQKLRGMRHLGGLHALTISDAGVTCYPRHEAVYRTANFALGNDRAETGIVGFDAMLGGGVNRATCAVLAGNPGVGKTLIGLHFLMAGAARGERGLLVSFAESAEHLYVKAAAFGLDLRGAVAVGQIDLLPIAPVELEVDVFAAILREHVERLGVRRLLLDSALEVERAILEPNRAPSFFAALFNYLRERDVTTLLTRESGTVAGPDVALSQSVVVVLTDTLVSLRTNTFRNRQYRTVSVLKMRHSGFDSMLHELRLDNGTVRVVPVGESDAAVLDGLTTLNSQVT